MSAAAPMTGEQIRDIAYALPPMKPKDMGVAVEVIAILFLVISILVVALRIYVRAGLSGAAPRFLGIEDYLAVIGVLPFIPAVAFASLSARYGLGMHDPNIPNPLYAIRAIEYQTYWELLYFASSTIVKCAIGFTCMRLDRRKRIVIPIATNMTVMLIIAVLGVIYVFANCKPFAATWNPALGKCQTVISLELVSYIVSAFQMVTDWVCATIPFFIVAQLQMNRRRKISVMMLLGLGIFASIATCIRLPFLKYYDTKLYPHETLYHIGVISITSNIECGLGIIGCSLPPLRKLFRFYYGSTDSGTYKNSKRSENMLGSSDHGIRLGSIPGQERSYKVSGGRGRDHETDDDDSSGKGIMRRTEVTVS